MGYTNHNTIVLDNILTALKPHSTHLSKTFYKLLPRRALLVVRFTLGRPSNSKSRLQFTNLDWMTGAKSDDQTNSESCIVPCIETRKGRLIKLFGRRPFAPNSRNQICFVKNCFENFKVMHAYSRTNELHSRGVAVMSNVSIHSAPTVLRIVSISLASESLYKIRACIALIIIPSRTK